MTEGTMSDIAQHVDKINKIKILQGIMELIFIKTLVFA